jgi:hypothetical protein
MPRFSIKGKPAGRTFHVGGKRFVTTNPVDGGASFSEEDKKFLETHGYELVKAPERAAIADPENRELTAMSEQRLREQLAKSRSDQAVKAAAGDRA